MSSYLLDTNITIDLLVPTASSHTFFSQCQVNGDEFYFSAITVAETLSGDKTRKKAIFEDGVIDVDKGIADQAANIRADQQANHNRKVKTPDAIIIATALLYGHTLVTNDGQMKSVCASLGIPTESI